jgi:hypothetical protein
VDVIGVRGIIFDCLSNDYDYYLYYPDKPRWYCTSNHGVGECYEHEAWWFYHYTGAIIADKFLRDGKEKILWDGVTGQYINDFAKLIQEVQKYQQLPQVNEASFHVEHALLWHFLASVMPDVTEYPSDLANALCGWDSHIRQHGVKGRGVGKGITHECYHGFGHAVFYVVAKRQARSMANQISPIKDSENHTFFASTSFQSAAAINASALQSTIRAQNTAAVNNDGNGLSLYVTTNNTVSISTKAAIEMAKSTTESSSARTQFRPNIGFEMTYESMCEVYRLCKGAVRKSDEFFDDKEEKYPYSHGVRICLEGVVHSVRLFSTDRHNKQGAINYVNRNMQNCQADEMRNNNHTVAVDTMNRPIDDKNKTISGNETVSLLQAI